MMRDEYDYQRHNEPSIQELQKVSDSGRLNNKKPSNPIQDRQIYFIDDEDNSRLSKEAPNKANTQLQNNPFHGSHSKDQVKAASPQAQTPVLKQHGSQISVGNLPAIAEANSSGYPTHSPMFPKSNMSNLNQELPSRADNLKMISEMRMTDTESFQRQGTSQAEQEVRAEIGKLEDELQGLLRMRREMVDNPPDRNSSSDRQQMFAGVLTAAKGANEGWRKIEKSYQDALQIKDQENTNLDKEIESMAREVELIDVELVYINSQAENMYEVLDILKREEDNLNLELNQLTQKLEKCKVRKTDLSQKNRTISYLKRELANMSLVKPAINHVRNISNQDFPGSSVNRGKQSLAAPSIGSLRSKHNLISYDADVRKYSLLETNFSLMKKVTDQGPAMIRVN